MNKMLNNYHFKSRSGDLAQLAGPKDKQFIVQLKEGEQLHTHAGVVNHTDLIDLPWGTQVKSHLGKHFVLLPPALDDLLRELPRNTQVIYPKDIGYILLNMGIGPGSNVIEGGTGSGAFTIALAHAVGTDGKVTTYERRAEMQELAKSNLMRVGLEDRVTFKLGDIKDGFDEKNAQALFLDIPKAENHITQVRDALMPGGFFGAILPTTNQVNKLIHKLEAVHFSFIEVSEIIHRFYKPNASRLRPVDRMTAHTGYLVFARPTIKRTKEKRIKKEPTDER